MKYAIRFQFVTENNTVTEGREIIVADSIQKAHDAFVESCKLKGIAIKSIKFLYD